MLVFSNVLAQEPPPPPHLPRVTTTDPLTRGLEHAVVQAICLAGVATVVDADYCAGPAPESRYHRTRYRLRVSEAWCGSKGEVDVYSHWAICPAGGHRYGKFTDTGISLLLNYLCVGDQIAFLAVHRLGDDHFEDPVLVSTLLSNDEVFVRLGNRSFRDIVAAAKSGEVKDIDEAVAVARTIDWDDMVETDQLRASVARAFQEAAHDCEPINRRK